MDQNIREKAKRFAAQCDELPQVETCCAHSVEELRKRSRKRDYGLLMSLCGVMVCNQLNLGVGQAVCQGLMKVLMNNVSQQVYQN
ncbi:hypothetical protein [Halodesulfovibrio marinisediminis]|uniref:Uncharacterized protein n=1 Tax=Halodesulfovibrio marinisediminis DSM 17456 TaxID=1121457 RepID=A0A1N6FUE0_9BACT|nr:hypothetical protein [Halodesulfovibrio marinisediminis]SIN98939.1 hypothetical protein SAMN02745161_1521 [Halodesulfovibrio marinisediminis DSM 17456]